MYTKSVYNIVMIRSFKDKETEKVFNGGFSKKLPPEIQRKAFIKMRYMHSSRSLKSLALIPSNHLESLSGKRIGEWSIRINIQWRITFIPVDGGSNYENVKIEDYH